MTNDYRIYLAKDKKLKPLLALNDPFLLKANRRPDVYLYRSIISQQLSTKAAAAIYNRFLQLFPQRLPGYDDILNSDDELMRSLGLSYSKIRYIKNVAAFGQQYNLSFKKLDGMDNAALIQHLTQIKGVGKWTVEMLLIFGLARQDVFSALDGGIQQAMIHLYGLEYNNRKDLMQQMEAIAEQWAPYRSFACLHLWKWKDTAVKNTK